MKRTLAVCGWLLMVDVRLRYGSCMVKTDNLLHEKAGILRLFLLLTIIYNRDYIWGLLNDLTVFVDFQRTGFLLFFNINLIVSGFVCIGN
jgi:hypothetical protein